MNRALLLILGTLLALHLIAVAFGLVDPLWERGYVDPGDGWP